MALQTEKSKTNAVPAQSATPASDVPRIGVGWRIAVTIWLLAFGALLCFELGDFLWKILKGLLWSNSGS
jgi:hypothetical protein